MPPAAGRPARPIQHASNNALYQFDAKIDWKALSKRIGHADVAFTMKQYVQTDLEADRQVANTLAELIIGGTLASVLLGTKPQENESSDEDKADDQGDENPAA